MPCGYADTTVSTHCYPDRLWQNNWQKMQMCFWLARSEATEYNVMCVEWQVQVTHPDTAGHYGVSAWHSNSTREERGKCQHTLMWPWHLVLAVSFVFSHVMCYLASELNIKLLISISINLSTSFSVGIVLVSCIEMYKWRSLSAARAVCNCRHTILNNKAKDMCPWGGEIAHYLWATFHLHSWLLWEPLWLWWKSHKPLLGDSTGLSADALMDSFVIGREGNDCVS